VMVARGWSDAQKRAYVIADNQLALNAGWDREFLGLSITLSRRRTKAGDVDYEFSPTSYSAASLPASPTLCFARAVLWRGAGVNA